MPKPEQKTHAKSNTAKGSLWECPGCGTRIKSNFERHKQKICKYYQEWEKQNYTNTSIPHNKKRKFSEYADSKRELYRLYDHIIDYIGGEEEAVSVIPQLYNLPVVAKKCQNDWKKQKYNNDLAENIVNLYHSLPKQNSVRPLLLQAGAKISISETANQFNVSKQTIYNAQKNIYAQTLKQMKYPINTTKKILSDETKEIIIKFWTENTRISASHLLINRSTKEKESIRWQEDSTLSLYNRFKEKWDDICCYNTFLSLRPWFVRWCRKREGICLHCHKYRELKNCESFWKQTNNAKKLNELAEAEVEYKKHLDLYLHQQNEYHTMVENLRSNQVIIIQDFAAGYLQQSKFETQDFFFNRKIITDLVITIIRNINNTIVYNYIDYLADDEKHDSLFVRHAWLHLMEHPFITPYQNIIVWSDTGPHHFRIRKTLCFFSELQEKYNTKKINYHFFAPGHGKSLCDSHTGVGKNAVRREVLKGKDIESASDIESVLINLKNTTPVVLEKINREIDDNCIELDDGIRQFFEWEFNENEVKGRKRSNEGEWITQPIYRYNMTPTNDIFQPVPEQNFLSSSIQSNKELEQALHNPLTNIEWIDQSNINNEESNITIADDIFVMSHFSSETCKRTQLPMNNGGLIWIDETKEVHLKNQLRQKK